MSVVLQFRPTNTPQLSSLETTDFMSVVLQFSPTKHHRLRLLRPPTPCRWSFNFGLQTHRNSVPWRPPTSCRWSFNFDLPILHFRAQVSIAGARHQHEVGGVFLFSCRLISRLKLKLLGTLSHIPERNTDSLRSRRLCVLWVFLDSIIGFVGCA